MSGVPDWLAIVFYAVAAFVIFQALGRMVTRWWQDRRAERQWRRAMEQRRQSLYRGFRS